MGDGGEKGPRQVVTVGAKGDIMRDLHCFICLCRRRRCRQGSNCYDDDGDVMEMEMETKRTND